MKTKFHPIHFALAVQIIACPGWTADRTCEDVFLGDIKNVDSERLRNDSALERELAQKFIHISAALENHFSGEMLRFAKTTMDKIANAYGVNRKTSTMGRVAMMSLPGYGKNFVYTTLKHLLNKEGLDPIIIYQMSDRDQRSYDIDPVMQLVASPDQTGSKYPRVILWVVDESQRIKTVYDSINSEIAAIKAREDSHYGVKEAEIAKLENDYRSWQRLHEVTGDGLTIHGVSKAEVIAAIKKFSFEASGMDGKLLRDLISNRRPSPHTPSPMEKFHKDLFDPMVRWRLHQAEKDYGAYDAYDYVREASSGVATKDTATIRGDLQFYAAQYDDMRSELQNIINSSTEILKVRSQNETARRAFEQRHSDWQEKMTAWEEHQEAKAAQGSKKTKAEDGFKPPRKPGPEPQFNEKQAPDAFESKFFEDDLSNPENLEQAKKIYSEMFGSDLQKNASKDRSARGEFKSIIDRGLEELEKAEFSHIRRYIENISNLAPGVFAEEAREYAALSSELGPMSLAEFIYKRKIKLNEEPLEEYFKSVEKRVDRVRETQISFGRVVMLDLSNPPDEIILEFESRLRKDKLLDASDDVKSAEYKNLMVEKGPEIFKSKFGVDPKWRGRFDATMFGEGSIMYRDERAWKDVVSQVLSRLIERSGEEVMRGVDKKHDFTDGRPLNVQIRDHALRAIVKTQLGPISESRPLFVYMESLESGIKRAFVSLLSDDGAKRMKSLAAGMPSIDLELTYKSGKFIFELNTKKGKAEVANFDSGIRAEAFSEKEVPLTNDHKIVAKTLRNAAILRIGVKYFKSLPEEPLDRDADLITDFEKYWFSSDRTNPRFLTVKTLAIAAALHAELYTVTGFKSEGQHYGALKTTIAALQARLHDMTFGNPRNPPGFNPEGMTEAQLETYLRELLGPTTGELFGLESSPSGEQLIPKDLFLKLVGYVVSPDGHLTQQNLSVEALANEFFRLAKPDVIDQQRNLFPMVDSVSKALLRGVVVGKAQLIQLAAHKVETEFRLNYPIKTVPPPGAEPAPPPKKPGFLARFGRLIGFKKEQKPTEDPELKIAALINLVEQDPAVKDLGPSGIGILTRAAAIGSTQDPEVDATLGTAMTEQDLIRAMALVHLHNILISGQVVSGYGLGQHSSKVDEASQAIDRLVQELVRNGMKMEDVPPQVVTLAESMFKSGLPKLGTQSP